MPAPASPTPSAVRPAVSGPLRPPAGILGILRHVGPGLIISANIVGSGELIVTPKVGAAHGFDLLWFIIVGCLLKVFVQIELGRYAVARGRTTLEALNEIPGPRLIVSWLVWLWLLMFAATFFQVAGMVGGIAGIAAAAGMPMNGRVVAVAIGGAVAILLVVGRYRTVETVSTAMVAAFTICTMVAVWALQGTPFAVTGGDLGRGFALRLPEDFNVAFAAFGIIGVGAAELIYYPYWCLEKGYARQVGPADGSAAWGERARGWMRVLRMDAWLSCGIYTLATLAFFLLGAAVLHDQGLDVANADMIPTLAHMYHDTFGAWSVPVFLVGAFAVLFSTIFVSTASNTRLIADTCVLFHLAPDGAGRTRERIIRWSCVLLPVSWVTIFVLWGEPVHLVLVGAIAQGFMLPFLGMAALWLHHRRGDPALRTGGAWRFLLWLSAACMVIVGAYQVANRLGWVG